MTLELTREQVLALDMALKTRVRAIEGLIYGWETQIENKLDNENTKFLIDEYTKELEILNK